MNLQAPRRICVKRKYYHTFTEEEAAELQAKGELRGRKTEPRVIDDWEGIFHGFGQEQIDGETYVVAIVEDALGHVHTPVAFMVRFINPLDPTSVK